MLNTPVALIIFNRPDTTAQVFTQIAQARPTQLFVVADGPRSDHPEDVERCAAARAMTEQVDWPCKVYRNYSDVNLGCGLRPASGISWLFDQVEEAIILEDDCVPRQSFFRFCQELLDRYRNEDRVMMVGGRYNQYKSEQWSREFKYSYDFAYTHTNLGWATWKRAWRHYDMEMKSWPLLRDTPFLQEIFEDRRVLDYWKKIFDESYAAGANADFWDRQWTFLCFACHGLAILPRTHLVSNIGFGPDATHTRRIYPELGALLTVDMEFPLVHPPAVERNGKLDRLWSARLVSRQYPGWRRRLRWNVNNICRRALRSRVGRNARNPVRGAP